MRYHNHTISDVKAKLYRPFPGRKNATSKNAKGATSKNTLEVG